MNTVIITDTRTREARDAADYLSARGWNVVTVPGDVPLCDEEALTGFAARYAPELCGVIHPAPPMDPFVKLGVEDISEELFALARDEGAIAAWCVTKVFGGIMRARGGGSLIYLNSIHAEKPVGCGALFSMGCAAAQMLQREANQDYGANGVRTYFVQRGISVDDPDARSDVSALYFGVDMRCPERRMPERGSLNGLLEFLLTPAAAPISGGDLRADGGMTMFYNNHRYRLEGVDYVQRK